MRLQTSQVDEKQANDPKPQVQFLVITYRKNKDSKKSGNSKSRCTTSIFLVADRREGIVILELGRDIDAA